MKTKLFATAAATSLVACSAFTAQPDPVTGIRQDAPAEWGNSDPLEFPGDVWGQAEAHPLLTWQGRNDFFFGRRDQF